MMFFGARIPVEEDAFPAVERFQYIERTGTDTILMIVFCTHFLVFTKRIRDIPS